MILLYQDWYLGLYFDENSIGFQWITVFVSKLKLFGRKLKLHF